MEYPHACSEQVFSRFYANSLASHIVDESPAIKQVFAEWEAKGEGNEEAFLSKLEKNSDLKNVGTGRNALGAECSQRKGK
jgi:hypothetical protein